MKRTPLKRKTPLSSKGTLKRTRIRVAGTSTTAQLKKEIQRLVREVVMVRDKGCILREARRCGGEIGKAVIQADHLITRANSATYADTRLIVCVCRNCHFWKKYHEKEYDLLVKQIISKERVDLWDRCIADRLRPVRMGAHDWKLEIINLKSELKDYEKSR